MLGNPSDVGHAMMLADSADSACGFPVFSSGCCTMCLLVPSTAVKAMVDSVVIVDMHRWTWVLLLLLMVRVSMVSATCVASLATRNEISLRRRARASRSRQKTPEACTESVTHAFFRASCAG